MLLVIIGWVFFRAANMTEALDVLAGMVGLQGFALRSDYAWQFTNFSLVVMILGAVIAVGEPVLRRYFALPMTVDLVKAKEIDRPRITRAMSVAAVILGVLAIVKLVADSDTPFLYFQF